MATKKKKKAPAKKAPAKKAALKAAAAALMPVVEQELDDNSAKLSRGYIRHAAGIYYETHLDGVSLHQMATEHDLFKTIPEKTLEKWMVADKWTERRKAFFAELHLKITKKLGDSLTQQHINMVGDFQKVSHALLERLLPADHAFLEVEGMETCGHCEKPYLPFHDPFGGVTGDKAVTALVKLNAEMREMTADLLQTILPQIQAANQAMGGSRKATGTPIEATLTKEEAREAAKSVLRHRQENIRAAQKGET